MRDDKYDEEMLDRVFLFGMTGLKKRLKKAENAVGFIALCTFAIVTVLLLTSDLGNTGAGVALSVLIGGGIGGGIACLAVPEKRRRRVVRGKFCAAGEKNRRAEKKENAA